MVEYKTEIGEPKYPKTLIIPDLNWNILPGTKDLSGWEQLNGITVTGQEEGPFVDVSYTEQEGVYDCLLSPVIHIGNNSDYTLSLSFNITYGLRIPHLGIFVFYEGMGTLSFLAPITWDGNNGTVSINDFLRFPDRDVRIGFSIGLDSEDTTNLTGIIGNIKLEKGSTATEWCPTLEEYIEAGEGDYEIQDPVHWNLIPNTDNMTEWVKENESYVTCTRIEQDEPKFRITSTAPGAGYLGIKQLISPIEGDKQYTISYVSSGFHEVRLVQKNSWSQSTGLINMGYDTDVNKIYTVTFTPNDLGVSAAVLNNPAIYILTTGEHYTDISYLKLEKGNTATPWCETKEEARESGDLIEPVNLQVRRLTDTNAAAERITTRLKHTTRDIPYYDKGVDIDLFTYGTPEASLRFALRDFMPNIKVDAENSRVQYFNIDIDISKITDGGIA